MSIRQRQLILNIILSARHYKEGTHGFTLQTRFRMDMH